jgi:hypothetical protein
LGPAGRDVVVMEVPAGSSGTDARGEVVEAMKEWRA